MDQCERYARENDATKILKVKIKIGVQSGVEPSLLKSSFDTFKEGTIADQAELDMEIEQLACGCVTCGHEFVPEKYDFLCPKCKSKEARIVKGKEMLLISLEME